jgi:hypothetical protein
MLLRVSERLSAEVLGRALGGFLSEHEQLRARYWREESGEWRQEVPDAVPEPELVEAGADELESVVERLQGERDLGREPMLRAALLRTPEGEANLLFVDVPHLVVDGVSWRVLVGDLRLACEQLLAGGEVRLPSASTSFKRWVELLGERAAGLEPVQQERREAGRLPLDHEGGENLASNAESVTVELGEEETRELLQRLPGAYRTRISEVLLTCLGHALGEWSGSRVVQGELEGHGREKLFEGVDLSRTVGWFTTQAPVLLELGQDVAARQGEREQLGHVLDDATTIDHLRSWGSSLRSLQEP